MYGLFLGKREIEAQFSFIFEGDINNTESLRQLERDIVSGKIEGLPNVFVKVTMAHISNVVPQ